MEPRRDLKGEMSMARILITGGAGFIGSHLVEHLLRRDHEILCLDNYFTGPVISTCGIIPAGADPP
jgi:UDP-glucuronate decarboxylase